MYVRYALALAATLLVHADVPDVAQSQSTLPGIFKPSLPANSRPRFAGLAAFPQKAADRPRSRQRCSRSHGWPLSASSMASSQRWSSRFPAASRGLRFP